MMLSALLSTLHLLSLAAGVSVLLARERALRGPLDRSGIDRVLRCDNISGLIAIVWMGSGLWRLLGGLEKGTAYYLSNRLFWLKMGLLGVAWCLESWPMVTFIRWRIALEKGRAVEPRHVQWLRRVHFAELAVLVGIVFSASLMARGVGARPGGAGADPAARRGALIYQRHCLPCHQADGGGLGGKVAADLRTRQDRPDQVLLQHIAEGVPGTAMVGFRGRLSDAEQRDVLAYVRAAFGGR